MAQHEDHLPVPGSKKIAVDHTTKMKSDCMDMDMQMPAGSTDGDSMTVMSHSFSLNLPMNRNRSGTAWQPDATPMYGYMKMTKKWNLICRSKTYGGSNEKKNRTTIPIPQRRIIQMTTIMQLIAIRLHPKKLCLRKCIMLIRAQSILAGWEWIPLL